MLLRVIPCLALVALLVSQVSCMDRGVLCQKWNEDCTLVDGNCCEGMKCQNVGGSFKCRDWQSSGGGGICKNRGELCNPGHNHHCCPGLDCKARLTSHNIHECR